MIRLVAAPVLFIALSLCFLAESYADVIVLKDGRRWEGIITSEDADKVSLNLGTSEAKFDRKKIQQILRSAPEQKQQVKRRLLFKRDTWENQKKRLDSLPKKVKLESALGHSAVTALVNGKYKVTLLIDTGASVVTLPVDYYKLLDMDHRPYRTSPAYLRIANGEKIKGWPVILRELKIGSVTAKNVQAVVLTKKTKGFEQMNGLLGMSFLRQYKFSIDPKNQCLILEKIT